MKVKDLKKVLEDLPDDLLVIMSKDGEGNGFSPLSDIGVYLYKENNSWSGEIDSESEKKNCVCLWPVN